MTSFLVASLLLAGQQQVGGGGAGGAAGALQPKVRGTQVQAEVWDSVKSSVAFLPDILDRPFGVAVLIDPQGYFIAHTSSIVTEPITAILEDGTKVRLGRIGYDSTTQIVLLGAQNWSRAGRTAITVSDPAYPAKDMTMVTVDGLVRSYVSRQNIPGVLASTNRYLPLNEVQFEGMSSPVGGALVFNRAGELMGILGATLTKAESPVMKTTDATAVTLENQRFGPQTMTIGYALSPKVLRRVVSGFLTPEHVVKHPNIGILFKDNQVPTGAMVTQVADNSPAFRAGIKEGDIVVQFDKEDLSGALELATKLFDKDPGETIEITYLRNLQKKTVSIKVGVADPTAQSLFL